MNGPRLGDLTFFNAMYLDRPGLEGVRDAVGRADWPGARRELATYLRRRESPKWFSNWRDREDPFHRQEVELVDVGDEAIEKVDLDLANKAVRNTLTSCKVEQVFGDTIDWELNPIDYREWTWQLSRHPFWVTLGQAYWKTGDEKYAQAFVRQMTHWAENVMVPVGEDGNSWKDDARMGSPMTNCWRTIECGIRMGQTWPYAYHYFLSSPSFTDDAICLMLKSMVEHARHLMRWTRSGNWLTMEANGMYHVGVLFPEFKEADEWRCVAMERQYKELDEQVYPDGAQIELSSGYHQVSLRNFVMTYNIAQLNAQPVPEDFAAKLERMYDYDLYLAMPDLRMPALNDGGWTDVRPWMRNALEFFPEREDFKWAATEGREGKRPTTLSTAFLYAGHFVMRTGWTPDDAYLFFDGGPFGFGHQHEDKLNVVIYSHGKVHATDPGNYPYDDSQWRKYVLSTRAHNTVMVDGHEQNQRGKPREQYVVSEPLPHTWVTQPSFDFVSASYEDGYGPERDRSVTHTRSILFIKPDLWVMTDFLEANDGQEHGYESMFHLDTLKADVVGNRKSVETRNRDAGNLGIYGVIPENSEVDIISGQEEPVVQGWIPRGKPYECQPLPTAVYLATGSGVTELTYVICPIAKGEMSPVSYVERLSPGSGLAAGRIAMKDGRSVHYGMRLPGSGPARSGAFESDCDAFAVIESVQGEVSSMHTIDGQPLTRQGASVEVGHRLLEKFLSA
ncbi:MAG: hypothetical protein CME19_11510 [Gemmatimonadetes bacterium]|nr:hypothetical protein [Gemmatimonadota bacterium]|tara:strand:+ start:1289 stop:3484 length:2196 start_codon:yes stop_codon:yes gene_type:complete